MRSCIYEGHVRHRRHVAPTAHARYALSLLYLDLDELPHVFDCSRLYSARRPAPAYLRRADYLGDPARGLAEEVRRVVRERTGAEEQGAVRMLANLRCLGHCFNPASFYYCLREERLRAAVVEVSNTPWGERHAYALGPEALRSHGSAQELAGSLPKRLRVSPLLGTERTYELRLGAPGARLAVHVAALLPDGAPEFDATLGLRRREIDAAALRRMLARRPLPGLSTLARIYADALRLRLRGARPHPRSAAGAAS